MAARKNRENRDRSASLNEELLPERPPPNVHLVRVELAGTTKPSQQLRSPDEAADFIRAHIGRLDRECFAVLHLSAKHATLSFEIVSLGALQSSLVHPREVFKGAILANAAAIICAHNHPSGDLTPSFEDHAVRKRLLESGELLGIPMLDFLIVTQNGYASVP